MQPTAATLIEVVEWEPALLQDIANKLVAESSFDKLSTVFEHLASQPFFVQGRRRKLRLSFLAVACVLLSLFSHISTMYHLGAGTDPLTVRLFRDYSALCIELIIPPLKQHGAKRDIASIASCMFDELVRPVVVLSLLRTPDVSTYLEPLSNAVIAMANCLFERNVKSAPTARSAQALLKRYLYFVSPTGDNPPFVDRVIHLLSKYALRAGNVSVVRSFSALTDLPAGVIEDCALDLIENELRKRWDPAYVLSLRTLAQLPNAPDYIKAAVELTLANL